MTRVYIVGAEVERHQNWVGCLGVTTAQLKGFTLIVYSSETHTLLSGIIEMF
jgi:hypothetical protein